MDNEEITKKFKKLEDLINVHPHDGVLGSFLTSSSKLASINYVNNEISSSLLTDSFKIISSSNNLKISLDTTRNNSSGENKKLKELTINCVGTLKVSYEIRSNTNENSVTVELRLNNTIIKTDTRSFDDGWGEYSMSNIAVKPGDVLTGWVASNFNYGEIKNWRVYYDVSSSQAGTIVTN